MSKKFLFLLLVTSFCLIGCSKISDMAGKFDEVMNNNVPDKTVAQLTDKGQSKESIKDAMAVDDLLRSGKDAGDKVKVFGKIGECVSVIKTADYEGPGDGCKIKGDQGELILDTPAVAKMKDEFAIVSGKVKYCGGKKKIKMICALTDSKLEK